MPFAKPRLSSLGERKGKVMRIRRLLKTLVVLAMVLLILSLKYSREYAVQQWDPSKPFAFSNCNWMGSDRIKFPPYPNSVLVKATPKLADWEFEEAEEYGCIFITPARPSEVQAFYDQRMAQAGWKSMIFRSRPAWEIQDPGTVVWMTLDINPTPDGLTRFRISSVISAKSSDQ